MAYKLRRAPLFGYDGSLCLGNAAPPTYKKSTPIKKKLPMECGVTASYTNGGPAAASGLRGGDVHNERSPAKSGLHVNFSDQSEVKKSREKFLTAKYGSHQMSLIRKRLAVEMWLYDELQKLYEIPASKTGNTEVEVDLDHLLDMDDDNQRRQHLQEILVDAKKSPLDVKKFVEDLLERAKTL
ncbi:protein phosphatase 1 regulatory subunit 14C [Neocloeon triangulifer]|uniref:protein phosphatase 1 regulatory subunit 14C n=1 Tax=Neocloeon triangulifer TaxID=2078957 RepID=UPI00286EBBD3|nr:protein phosphatase 1 regulatory subunit 14C [Neocloeon triangulifer]